MRTSKHPFTLHQELDQKKSLFLPVANVVIFETSLVLLHFNELNITIKLKLKCDEIHTLRVT